jgi:hypothetical protein
MVRFTVMLVMVAAVVVTGICPAYAWQPTVTQTRPIRRAVGMRVLRARAWLEAMLRRAGTQPRVYEGPVEEYKDMHLGQQLSPTEYRGRFQADAGGGPTRIGTVSRHTQFHQSAVGPDGQTDTESHWDLDGEPIYSRHDRHNQDGTPGQVQEVWYEPPGIRARERETDFKTRTTRSYQAVVGGSRTLLSLVDGVEVDRRRPQRARPNPRVQHLKAAWRHLRLALTP